jgi:PTH1 family peptidyl-tRNA hydrolase
MPDNTDAKLIIGLGNPGPGTADTRHNAGYMALTIFASRFRITSAAAIGSNTVSSGDVLGQSVLLAWPAVFMEHSGKAAREMADRFKIENLENILVIHDDTDLEPGGLRLAVGGGPLGHNGYKSVRDELGGDFAHLSVGVGKPKAEPDGSVQTTKEYVLSPFEFDELDTIRPALVLAAEAARAWLTEGFGAALKLLESRQG